MSDKTNTALVVVETQETKQNHFLENRQTQEFQKELSFAKFLHQLDEVDKEYFKVLVESALCQASKIRMTPAVQEKFEEFLKAKETLLNEFRALMTRLNEANTFEYPKAFRYMKKQEEQYTDFVRSLVESERAHYDEDIGPRSFVESGKEYLEDQIREYFFNSQSLESSNERILEMHIYAFTLFIHKSDKGVAKRLAKVEKVSQKRNGPDAIQRKQQEQIEKAREIAAKPSEKFEDYLHQAEAELEEFFKRQQDPEVIAEDDVEVEGISAETEQETNNGDIAEAAEATEDTGDVVTTSDDAEVLTEEGEEPETPSTTEDESDIVGETSEIEEQEEQERKSA